MRNSFKGEIMKNFIVKSNIRLPFEPKNDALKLKKEIRENLRKLDKDDCGILYAYLATSKKEFFDVENVLFYNVGSGAFNGLSVDEINFELKYDAQSDLYEYFYGLFEETPLLFDNSKLLLTLETLIPHITSSCKPIDYWHLINQANVEQVNNYKINDNFSIDIELGLKQRHPNIVSLIKPMIDGIISSFHFQIDVSESVLNIVSRKLDITNDKAKEMFSEKPFSILGERKLVSLYRNGIKWNPEDEKCTKVRVRQYKSDKSIMKIKVYSN